MSTSVVRTPLATCRRPRVAELFGVKRETIYRHVRRGILPAVRLGGSIRIPEAELHATLEATHTGPTGKASA